MKKTNLFITLVSITALASCGNGKQHLPSDTFSNIDENYHFRGCQACDDYHFQEPHTWEVKEVKNATCTEEGVTYYTCECGATKEEKVDPLGHISGETYYVDANGHHTVCSRPDCNQRTDEGPHNFELVEDVKATCETDGHKTYKCECGIENVETSPKTGHSYDAPWTINSETHNKYCNTCGKLIESSQHEFDYDIQEPTCTLPGRTLKTCRVCGYKTITTTNSTGHNYVTDQENATCTEGGYTKTYCTNCGDVILDTKEDPKGHDYEYASHDELTHAITCKTCNETHFEEHNLTTREVAASVSNCEQTITECTECDYSNVVYTGPHAGGHHCNSTDQMVELDDEYCGIKCQIPGCDYVQYSRKHYYGSKKIYSYPDGDKPGTEAKACIYCGKALETTEFTGDKVSEINIVIPVMPTAGIPMKDWFNFTIIENVAPYWSNSSGTMVIGAAITTSLGEVYNFNSDMTTVFREEQLSGGYTLDFYINPAPGTYWEWDNEKLTPAIPLIVNEEYTGYVKNSARKMSGYWDFTVAIN